MILSIVVDDGSGSIAVTFIGDVGEELTKKDIDEIMTATMTTDTDAVIESLSQDLMGKTIAVKGKVKYSDYSNAHEMTVFAYLKKKEKHEERYFECKRTNTLAWQLDEGL